jgi:hypothetical protein
MADRGAQLKIMGVLLAGIGLFVTTPPSAPDAGTLQASAARASRVADGPTKELTARARLGRTNARPSTRAAGTDALDGGTGAARTTARSGTSAVASKGVTAPAVRAATVRRSTVATTRPPVTTTTPAGPTVKHCSDFTWQQDAQAAYVANLADPWGLDGPPGPADDDGIACSLLPVDPSRPASTPSGAPDRSALRTDESIAGTPHHLHVAGASCFLRSSLVTQRAPLPAVIAPSIAQSYRSCG